MFNAFATGNLRFVTLLAQLSHISVCKPIFCPKSQADKKTCNNVNLNFSAKIEYF